MPACDPVNEETAYAGFVLLKSPNCKIHQGDWYEKENVIEKRKNCKEIKSKLTVSVAQFLGLKTPGHSAQQALTTKPCEMPSSKSNWPFFTTSSFVECS
jgi:hypothetical protein